MNEILSVCSVIAALFLGAVIALLSDYLTSRESYKNNNKNFIDFKRNTVPAKMTNSDVSIDEIIGAFKLID